ncbi:hypothetical protein [Wenzhouxiangella marina]|uniref:Cadherin n=1 Tax=Wenzhouxiangella marina TaxID=1579979 RepID=A0A0K0XXT1_9GAMM|nr:hypothetical protein [Wenzhouxiangella marina]AKS42485.1 Cadherin [Wenzhouxiangella marina]MBB6085740.1 hypothetical protein [Wenzhouxiangella marina]
MTTYQTIKPGSAVIATLIGLAMLLASAPASAVWPTAAGGDLNDRVEASAVGPNGNVYVAGRFSGEALFGGSTFITARGADDAFVARYNQAGNLQWVVRAGSARSDRAVGIAVDEAGFVYVTGTFIGEADFGPFELSSNGLAEDIFVAKIDSDGDWVWAKSATGPKPDFVTGIGVIPGNPATIPQTPAQVVIAGHYQCNLRLLTPASLSEPAFDQTIGAGGCSSGNDPDQHFLAAMDSDGRWRWAFNADANGSNATRILDLDVSDDGRALVIGEHSGAITIGGVALPDTTPGGADFTAVEGNWQLISTPYNRGVSAMYVPNTAGISLKRLRLDEVFDFSASVNPRLSFQNRFRLDLPSGSCYDVAYLEYSTNGGTSWTRFSASSFLAGGYNGAGNGLESNPVSGEGWCNTSPGWPEMRTVEVDLSGLVGQSSVQFQWVLGEGSAVGEDGFYIDDVEVFEGALRIYSEDFEPSRRQFVARVGNVADGSPSWSWLRSAPDNLKMNSIAVGPEGDAYLAGEASADVVLPDAGSADNIVNPGAVAGRLSGSDGTWIWGRSATGGEAVDLVATADGVFIAGHFSGTAIFLPGNPDGTIQATAQRDLFVARSALSNGAFQWVSGGDRYNGSGGVPGKAGGPGDAEMRTLSTDGLSNLYVGGDFSDSLTFGKEATLTASAGRNGFVANLNLQGVWFEVQTWLVGEIVPPPASADTSDLAAVPDIYIDGELVLDAIGRLFFWARPTGADAAMLTALDAIDGVEVHWKVAGDPPGSSNRIVSVGRTAWPGVACSAADDSECYQVHIAGAPVETDEPGSAFRYVNNFPPQSQSSGAVVNAGVMTASEPGFTVLMYVEGTTTDPFQFPLSIEVVRTFRPNQSPDYAQNVRWDIGEPIIDAFHNQPGRAGYVLNEAAFYDGVGSEASYDREARTGHIIAVNKVRPNRLADAGKDMTVAWYRRNAMGIYWPQRAINYAPDWPLDPERIIVASQTGAEVLGQEPLSPILYPELRIYQQPVPSLPGYNPNATHAFFAPSNTGSGILALFALRADFGINLPGDLTSATDPYVLIKYWNQGLDRWAYRVFYVTATGAGFDGFQFGGEAGTAVQPPYPLSILPGCSESLAVGQAANDPQPPPPFFKDYKNGLWSKSAGEGSMRFWYPLQPGMVYDPSNDDFPEALEGQCIPWMARLPVDQGGSASPTDPIEVDYTFTWPAEAPQLIPGETLLRQKRGLPNIFQQDAVEVVFDEFREAEALTPGGAGPDDTLVQLIDPLTPRFVILDSLEGLGTQLDPVTGYQIVVGDSDGLLSLPVSIRERLRYDPINKRLIFSGVFDDSLAGEPMLLLNIMSFREAEQLKVLDGSAPDAAEDMTKTCASVDDECSWAEAIEALLRVTRNPNGIRKICEASQTNPSTGVRTCTDERDPFRGELLAAFQDPFIMFNFDDDPTNDVDEEGFLEPYQAVGVTPALSAGATRGTGWVTLAFNNDQTLSPAPVSIQIIRVDCLVDPLPPAPAEIFRSYQGQLNVIAPDNIFDEQVTLRHSGDFGGRADELEFEWYFQPDLTGLPPEPLPNPDTGQLNGWQRFPVDDPQGAIEIVVEGANIQTLSDNWYLARYRGLSACNNENEWSLWAGGPGGTPRDQRAQLALGWVKRVIERLNPFEARVQDFHSGPTNTFSSMLTQLGERYEGDIPLTSNPAVLNQIGLIEAYTTVMRRALDLSVNAVPPVDYGPANTAILNVASRISEFYALLGNEAYADAQDPTVGLLTSGEFASMAPAIFPFQNQLASVLEEELILLRGRDTSQATTSASPVYNRLFWNFTTGDGEVAYALNYGISDFNNDGVIDEFDARIQYPQGHGDAWGHYLTGLKTHYQLLRNPFFTWEPRAEAVPVAGVPIQVDFFDERRFATVAAAKARTGAEIVNLTYRQFYVEDPNAQWQGYKDDDEERAWGLSEWARRAGQGAYFDWVVANAILPDEDTDPGNLGIQKVDRTRVDELDEIVASFDAIQAQLDGADRGLNPLGLARDVVPFDIDPSRVEPGPGPNAGQTHFEQIYLRAKTALDNAVKAWDYANQINRMLRFNQDTEEEQFVNSRATETDFNNRLIEIFGYPYPDDVGPGGIYPTGYNGPDVYHYMYVDVMELVGQNAELLEGFDIEGDVRLDRFTATYSPLEGGVNFFGFQEEAAFWDIDCPSAPLSSGCALGDTPDGADDVLNVEYVTYDSPAFGFSFGKPPEWTGRRRATGTLQNILHDMFSARLDLVRALREYQNLSQDIKDMIDTISATFAVREEQLSIANNERRTLNGMNIAIQTLNQTAKLTKAAGNLAGGLLEAGSECIPKNTIAGLAAGGDVFSAGRCSLKAVGIAANAVTDGIGEVLEIAANGVAAAQADVSQLAALEVQTLDSRLDVFNLKGQFDEMLRREPLLRMEMYSRIETIEQHYRRYLEELARGQRLMAQLIQFRKTGAAATQEYRYQDMAFRIFRNDALQKYRAAFDMAARYVFLAAVAYDYETNLLGSDQQAGQNFLTDIVRERSLGQILDGEPVPSSNGLADAMGRMRQNFDVLKGQLGFNNPQVETNRFSLRRELFRIEDTDEGDEQWRRILSESRVDNLWNLPEFRRFARPPQPESAGPLPGLVFRFPTTVSFGLNFFHWPLGPGDSTYDPTRFATKVRSVGTWFRDYAGLPLSETPRVYLFPVGADVLRSPASGDFRIREWQVIDQLLPVPFPIGSQDLDSANWIPLADSLSDAFNEVRRYSQFRAYHFTEPFDAAQVTSDSRLIGRSVWNREWVLIIPGGGLLADPDEGLDTFIDGRLLPDSDERDGEGVSDIRVFFETYSYSGN